MPPFAIGHLVVRAIICLTALSLVATTLPANSTSAGVIHQLSLNDDVTAIDSRFTIKSVSAGPFLPEDECLMQAVKVMSVFAQINFDQPVRPEQTFWNAKYRDVSIKVQGDESRYIVWGLYLSIRRMIIGELFETAEFRLIWEDKVVGYISYFKPPTQLALPSANSDTDILSYRDIPAAESTNGSYILNGTAPLASAPNEFHYNNGTSATEHLGSSRVSVDMTRYGETMTKLNVFVTILDGLLYIAPFSKSLPLDPFEAHSQAPFSGALTMTYYRAHTMELNYGVAARSLPLIPETMVRAGYYREAYFNVLLDGSLVGKGKCVIS